MKYTKTRIAFLGYTQIAANEWRYVHLEDGRNAVVGDVYGSEKELLADLTRYSSTWGTIDPQVDGKVQPGELLVRTTASVGFDVKWDILLCLSDRWGDLITPDGIDAEFIAAQKILSDDPKLLERLQSMMRDEITFIGQKDGQFGVLFEVEYCSAESEVGVGACEGEYPPEAVMFERLIGYAAQLEAMFPGQQFAVPEPTVIIQGRPALWAFVPLDAATPERLDAIAKASLDFAYPEPAAA